MISVGHNLSKHFQETLLQSHVACVGIQPNQDSGLLYLCSINGGQYEQTHSNIVAGSQIGRGGSHIAPVMMFYGFWARSASYVRRIPFTPALTINVDTFSALIVLAAEVMEGKQGPYLSRDFPVAQQSSKTHFMRGSLDGCRLL